jgi:hypothetical protein
MRDQLVGFGLSAGFKRDECGDRFAPLAAVSNGSPPCHSQQKLAFSY